MAEPIAYLNGEFLPQSQAHLTLHDAGFVMGATVTDLVRTFGRRLFQWDAHLARFRESCARACLDVNLDEAGFGASAKRVVEQNGALLAAGQELALVMFATPGPIGYYLGEPGGVGDGPATLGMHTFPLPFARYRSLFERGAHLAAPSVLAIPEASVDPRIKQRSRLHWWLAEQEVKRTHPGASALLRDEAGFLTETAAANFLIVKDGTIATPPAGKVLPGISLGVVRELAAELKIGWEERPLTLDEALGADEALISSTSFCLAGVSRLQGRDIPWPGPVWGKLREAWSRAVGFDFVEQVLRA